MYRERQCYCGVVVVVDGDDQTSVVAGSSIKGMLELCLDRRSLFPQGTATEGQ